MSEPLMPVPPHGENEYWDPAPARCEECGVILQDFRQIDGEWVGWCPTHNRVPLYYPDSQPSEDLEEEG